MSSFDQVPFSSQSNFAAAEFADNPEPRCPCLLLLDNSGSMAGRPISELNTGLTLFKEELVGDALAAKRVEVGIVSFGPASVVNDFQTADLFQAPVLTPHGDTPMGAAIVQSLDMIEQRSGMSRVAPTNFIARPDEQLGSSSSRKSRRCESHFVANVCIPWIDSLSPVIPDPAVQRL